MKIMKNFLKCFGKLFCDRLKYRGMYTILNGEYAGAFFVYIEEENRGNSKALLLMPEPMKSIYISEKDVEMDLKYDNIIFVTKLPKEIYDVVRANFIHYAKGAGIYASR